MKNRWVMTLLAFWVVIIFASACSSAPSNPAPATTISSIGATPPSTTTLDGATLVADRCSRCHPLTFIEKSRHTASDWKLIVDLMISRGAQLTPDEETIVVNYLSATYGQ